MSAEDARRERRERGAEGAVEQAGWAACCGPAMFDATEGCPCAGAFKSHRLVCTVILVVLALAFLVSQVGGVAGIVAFFRTL